MRMVLAFFMTLFSLWSWGQTVWNYDFGTGTGSFTSSTASTTFLPTPQTNGGTARVRVGTNPGSIILANPGLALGAGSELQFKTNSGSTSTTKFSIYDFTASKVGYLKSKVTLHSGTAGAYLLTIGDGATFSDNNAMASTQVFAGLRWTFGTSNSISTEVLNNTTWGTTGLTGSTTLFAQGAANIYEIEIYYNNSATSTSYQRNGSHSLANAKWDLWVNGAKVAEGLAKGGLGTDSNIDSFTLNHQSSVAAGTQGTVYMDDIEYSNGLPSATIRTISTNPTSLSGFTYAEGSGPSAEQSFTVTGSNLADPVAVSASTNWEVSLTSGSGFGNAVSLPVSGGKVYARLVAGLLENPTYAGTVTLSSTEATNAVVNLTGSVTAPPATPVVTGATLNGSVGGVFSHQVVATQSPTSYAVASGSLPSGLSLSTTSGVISGTPTQSGTFNATITASNGSLNSEPASFDFSIVQGIQTAALPDINVNVGVANITLPASTSAGLPITYVSDTPSVANVSGNILTLGNVGTATITASQSGNAEYAAFNDSFMVTVAVVDHLVISQVYGAGGNSGAIYNRDYVELFNPTNAPISLNGYTLQYASATGTTWTNSSNNYLPNVYIQPGKYFLIQTTLTGSNGSPLPVPDFTYVTAMDMSGSNGKVALVNSTVTLSGANPTATSITDLVGFGNANGYEGSAAAPGTGVTTSAVRKLNGRQDMNNNANDFETASPLPRNSSFPTVTWNGTAWSNTTGPDSTMPAIIAGDYSGPAFESQSLTVDAGATLTVSDYIKTGNITNNGNIIVANNANFVQTGTFTAGGSSSFKVKKDSKAVKRQAYIDWSSPMEGSGQTLKGFSYGKLADGVTNQSVSGTLDNRFYTYNNNAFVATPATGTFVAGQGYQIRTPNDFTTAPQVFHGQFEGVKPNSGTVNYDHSAITGDYVLLGNPYPGAISVADFLTANPGTTEIIYSWNSQAEMDANSLYTGINYNTYAPGTGAVPAGSMDGNIPVGQGFFVARGTAASPFVFNDGMRQSAEDGIFSKSTAADRFWLEMNSPSGAKPQMLLAFNAAAGEGYDKGYDAKMFSRNTDVLYSTVDDQSLIIDSHGVFDTSDAFALNANFSTAGNYTISVLQKEGRFSSSQKIYLKDNVTGAVTDISSGTYTFTATAGVQENRFTVQFRPGGVLATDTAVKSGTAIFSSGKEIHVKADGKIASVEVYDMSGKRIAVKSSFDNETVMSVTYTGTVVVKVSLQNGIVQTKKIMIK